MATTFSIFKSSAGSGKTRTLAKEYLKLVLRANAGYYRHILAVTFTNKASQEMKDRILFYLNEFANGHSNELAEELKKELSIDDHSFQQRSQEIQADILHNYAQFSISTIDAFFQKVIRSFTRESGLVGDYRLEVEHDPVMEQVIDNLIDELGQNAELTDWVVEFARENLENERAWDVRLSLLQFSQEIFREEFRQIEDEVTESTSRPGYFRELRQTLWSIRSGFLNKVSAPAKQIADTIRAKGWSSDDFLFGKGSGLETFLRNFGAGKNLSELKIGSRIRTHFLYPEKWPARGSVHAADIVATAKDHLAACVQSIVDTYDRDYPAALSADAALKNLYVFGLITDISRKLREYKDDNNLMLLADAPKFLNGVIRDSDTPFIYEKVGSFYRNYLIDEFQDTSGMQWKNFQPLIINSLDQGYSSFVVGDVKQAIYRWRGGDLTLLQRGISGDVGEHRIKSLELDRNFRSAATIVEFNNKLFRAASTIVSTMTGTQDASGAYADVPQVPAKDSEGFVRIRFISEREDVKEDDTGKTTGWKTQALEEIPRYLETLQQAGIPLREIAILVRKNDEGQRIAAHLLNYKNSPEAVPGCRYDVVSNESLRIDGAASVNLLLGAMHYLLNPDNAIARAQLAFEYARLHGQERELAQVFAVTNQATFENDLPPAFTKEKLFLRKLALIELTENLIRIFGLGGITGELLYLQAFQDLVLDFASRERNDLEAFLEWWEENKHKRSIQIPGDVDAAQIITIHKSKGLQFPYVIVPFCSWGLDHENWQAPNLWVKAETPPFADLGFIPVKYSSALENTFFASAYAAERTRCYLDNLNLLYVAFTRAARGMIVMAPSPDIRGAKETVAAVLKSAIETNDELRTHWNDNTASWSFGSFPPTPGDAPARKTNAVMLEKYLASPWHDKLVIKRTGISYFQGNDNGRRERIAYGVQMHAVLSRIADISSIDETIERLAGNGTIAAAEKDDVAAKVRSLMSIPQVAAWFSPEWKTETEVPILLPGGESHRIDRLLMRDRQAIVIDYKTGAPSKSDKTQVQQYMSVLKEMGFTDITGFILYLRDSTVVEVKVEGRQKLVRKLPDKDQLSLGF